MSFFEGKRRRAALIGALVIGLGFGGVALVGALSGQQPTVETFVTPQGSTAKAERVKGPKKNRSAQRPPAGDVQVFGVTGSVLAPDTTIVVSDEAGVRDVAAGGAVLETLTENHIGAMDLAVFGPTMSPHEAEATQLAAEARKLAETEGGGARYASLRERVAKLLGLDFDARLSQQETEARLLRERLVRIEKQLENRRKLRDQIVTRRADELLNPDLKWHGADAAAGGATRDVNVSVRRAPDGTLVREETAFPAGTLGDSQPTIVFGSTAELPQNVPATGTQRTATVVVQAPTGSPIPPVANPASNSLPAGHVVARDAVQAALGRMSGSAGGLTSGPPGNAVVANATPAGGELAAPRTLSPLDATRFTLAMAEAEEKLNALKQRLATNDLTPEERDVAPEKLLRAQQQHVDALRGQLAALQALQARAVEFWTEQLKHATDLREMMEKSAAKNPLVDWPDLRLAQRRSSEIQKDLEEMSVVLKMLERLHRKPEAVEAAVPAVPTAPAAPTAPASGTTPAAPATPADLPTPAAPATPKP